jgi:GntR family transcriptional regulator, transcriptional repressor for pyruvate dehydrogenase complex
MTSEIPETFADGFRVQQVTRPRAQVEEQLKAAILHGLFAQGEKLPSESDLAHQFGVSRPTLREALGALASAGLIRKVPGVAGGNFVNTVTASSLSTMLGESMNTILRLGSLHVDEITDVRRLLEIPAAGWAASNRTTADLAEMRQILDRQRSTTVVGSEIVTYDLQFHTMIGRASGNRLLAAFVSAVHAAAHPVRYLDMTVDVGKASVDQHLAILTAIQDGDANRATTAMSQHLDYFLRYSSQSTATEEP